MEKEPFSPSNPSEDQPQNPIQRVVGARLSEEARQNIFQEQAKKLQRQERPEWTEHEIAKSQELNLLELANHATDRLLQRFGREPLHIPPDNFHLLDEEGRKQVKLGWESGGAYSIDDEAVFMRPEGDPVVFSLVAYHETLHFKSYQALQRLYPGKEVLPYRRGFEVITRHGHRSYFRHLDEAVIQELSNRFVREQLFDNTVTKDAIAASERRRSLVLRHRNKLPKEDVEFLEELVPYVADLPEKMLSIFSETDPSTDQVRRAFTDCKHRNLFVHPYAKYVRGLHSLVDAVYDGNRGQFSNKEEVLNLFVEAVITGNVLSIGRTIERTFGKGSFRRLGEGQSVSPKALDHEEEAL